jgi:hypothetical protein
MFLPRALGSLSARAYPGLCNSRFAYHMAMSGFPFPVGTTLWKTMCEEFRIVAWRGLQHGACKSGSRRKIFGLGPDSVPCRAQKRRLVQSPLAQIHSECCLARQAESHTGASKSLRREKQQVASAIEHLP